MASPINPEWKNIYGLALEASGHRCHNRGQRRKTHVTVAIAAVATAAVAKKMPGNRRSLRCEWIENSQRAESAIRSGNKWRVEELARYTPEDLIELGITEEHIEMLERMLREAVPHEEVPRVIRNIAVSGRGGWKIHPSKEKAVREFIQTFRRG